MSIPPRWNGRPGKSISSIGFDEATPSPSRSWPGSTNWYSSSSRRTSCGLIRSQILSGVNSLGWSNPQAAVIIQEDEESKNGLLVAVMDAAKLAGIENVSIAAEIID